MTDPVTNEGDAVKALQALQAKFDSWQSKTKIAVEKQRQQQRMMRLLQR